MLLSFLAVFQTSALPSPDQSGGDGCVGKWPRVKRRRRLRGSKKTKAPDLFPEALKPNPKTRQRSVLRLKIVLRAFGLVADSNEKATAKRRKKKRKDKERKWSKKVKKERPSKNVDPKDTQPVSVVVDKQAPVGVFDVPMPIEKGAESSRSSASVPKIGDGCQKGDEEPKEILSSLSVDSPPVETGKATTKKVEETKQKESHIDSVSNTTGMKVQRGQKEKDFQKQRVPSDAVVSTNLVTKQLEQTSSSDKVGEEACEALEADKTVDGKPQNIYAVADNYVRDTLLVLKRTGPSRSEDFAEKKDRKVSELSPSLDSAEKPRRKKCTKDEEEEKLQPFQPTAQRKEGKGTENSVPTHSAPASAMEETRQIGKHRRPMGASRSVSTDAVEKKSDRSKKRDFEKHSETPSSQKSSEKSDAGLPIKKRRLQDVPLFFPDVSAEKDSGKAGKRIQTSISLDTAELDRNKLKIGDADGTVRREKLGEKNIEEMVRFLKGTGRTR